VGEQVLFAVAAIGTLGFGVGVVFFVVMFLFVIAYLGDRGALPGPDRLDRWQVFGWLGLIGLGLFGTVAILDSTAGPARPAPETTDVGSPASIGDAFLSSHLLAFEVTSLVLLVAAVGAVILAKGAVQGEGGR